MVYRSHPGNMICAAALLLSLAYGPSVCAADNHPTGKPTHLDSVATRFASSTSEVPDFQRHVSPLLGRLGCNGRACHGSFQGKGGFRLSLFGYDFQSDHAALLKEGHYRVDREDPPASLILTKPTDADMHEGGLRYQVDSWQYNLLKGWIENGALPAPAGQHLESLEISPSEIIAGDNQSSIQLEIVARWSDGSREDVTPLCRFQSNDPAVAQVDSQGIVSSIAPGDTHVVVFYDNAVVTLPVLLPVTNSQPIDFPAETAIDRLVKAKLEKLHIQPSPVADDVTFLRRVSLDISGTLPSPKEIRDFVDDPDRQKRSRKIDELLESPAYAAWWTTFLCDLTENNSRQLRNIMYNPGGASRQWYEWIHSRIEKNIPYDELVEGIVMAVSRESGESLTEYFARMTEALRNGESFTEFDWMPYYWMRREYQDGEKRAISFAHTFMGIRIQCAQCHKHPFDQWTQDDFQQFSRFFTGVTTRRPPQVSPEERDELAQVYQKLGIDPRKTRGGELRKKLADGLQNGVIVPFPELQVTAPRSPPSRQPGKKRQRQRRVYTDAILLGSNAVDLTEFDDVRQPVMTWLRQPDNPYFARAFVNRVWSRYFGVGIVEPADDLNLANPPSNGPLLDYLTREFVSHDYDMKWLHREIANSRTYQLSWEPNETNSADRRNFSRALPRRLPAELMVDAIVQASASQTVNAEFRNSVQRRAIAIPDLSGYRPNPRQANAGFALRVFGKSTRSTSCDCDRSEETSLVQSVYLQNDRDIHAALARRDGWIGQLAVINGSALSESQQRQLAKWEQRLAQMRQRQQQLEKRGDQAAAKKLSMQITRLDQKVKPFRQRQKTASQQLPQELEPRDLIREAYLRTLSRFPTESEMRRCLEFFDGSENVVSGATGVMWALINSKEFVVNH